MKCIICNNNKFSIITDKVRYDIPIKVIKCKNCSLVSLENPMSNTIDYDDPNYRKKHSPVLGKELSPKEMFKIEIQFQPQRIKRIAKLINSNSRILEIGSSTGHFLHSIRNLVKEVVGIELNKEHANYAKKSLGLEIYDKPLEVAPIQLHSFDVIFMFQVFEHIPNPLEFILLCKKFLKKTGKIYIEVPNVDDILLKIYNISQFQNFYFRIPHIYYYSTNTIDALLTKAGFRGEISTVQEYTFFNHIHWLTTGKPQKSKTEAYKIIDWKHTSKDLDNILTEFFSSVNEKYKKILEENKIAENICYVGIPINE